jgi:hypothetical protein
MEGEGRREDEGDEMEERGEERRHGGEEKRTGRVVKSMDGREVM